MTLLLKRGYYQSVELLILKYYIPNSVDVSQTLSSSISEIRTSMDSSLRLSRGLSKSQTLIPVVKWGQNKTHVLLNSKFAHRFGSPGCLDVWDHQFEAGVTDFSFKALGIQTDYLIKIKLEVDLFQEIVP